MFKKSRSEDDNFEALALETAPSPSRNSNGSASVLGPTLVFKGELQAEEDLVIEGRIEGSIQHHEKNLTIGPQGMIKADINAKVITVEGTVDGDLMGDLAVILKSTAQVQGNIAAPRIVIEDGAKFNGRVDMVLGELASSDDSEDDDDYSSSMSYEAAS